MTIVVPKWLWLLDFVPKCYGISKYDDDPNNGKDVTE